MPLFMCPNRIECSFSQVIPRDRPSILKSFCAAPPDTGIFIRIPFTSYASHLASGEKVGYSAPFVPASGCKASASVLLRMICVLVPLPPAYARSFPSAEISMDEVVTIRLFSGRFTENLMTGRETVAAFQGLHAAMPSARTKTPVMTGQRYFLTLVPELPDSVASEGREAKDRAGIVRESRVLLDSRLCRLRSLETCFAACVRSFGSFSRHSVTIASSSGEMSGLIDDIGGESTFT